MKEDLLYHRVSDHLKSVEKHLCAYTKDGKSKHLHLLRLDIKIINALFSFVEDLYNDPYSPIELKSIYQKTGEIREIQIIGSSKYLPKKIIRKLKKKEKLLNKKFQKVIPWHIKFIESLRKRVTLPSTLPDKQTIKSYFEGEFIKVNQDFQNKDRNGLHEFRKNLKKLQFIYNALPKKIRKEVNLKGRHINKLQEEVGNWHDTYSAIEFLSYRYFKKKSVGYISKLRQKEERQFDALFANCKPL